MVRVAIVGCGKIADQHVQAIRRIPGSTVVAVCDREALMAGQLAERFGIKDRFQDMGAMLKESSPDVVHLTTPPQSHHALARQCLEAGAHVYVEKPFTVTAGETESLIDLAERKRLRVTAGHNYQFTPEMLEMRRLVRDGYLGSRPVHLESFWSYDLGDLSYVGPMLADPSHWVRRLPGQLFHNVISHGIARLAEWLLDDVRDLVAWADRSAQLAKICPQGPMDELRVMARDRAGTTAFFSFSTQMKPGINQFRLLGDANSITVDGTSGSLIRHRGRSYKSYLTFLMPQVEMARAYLGNGTRNVMDILRWRLHHDAGMKALIERFHQSIVQGSPAPIPYREILLTARLMDSIFAQLQSTTVGRAIVIEA
jgi:predicted dehydrogenase